MSGPVQDNVNDNETISLKKDGFTFSINPGTTTDSYSDANKACSPGHLFVPHSQIKMAILKELFDELAYTHQADSEQTTYIIGLKRKATRRWAYANGKQLGQFNQFKDK